MKSISQAKTSLLMILGLMLAAVAGAQENKGQAKAEEKEESVTEKSAGDVYIYERTLIGTGDESRLLTTVILPDGIKPKEDPRLAAAEEAIRNVLSTAVEAALAGDTNKLIEQLSGPDRERFEPASEVDLNPWTRTTGFLEKTWKESYGLTTRNLTPDDLSATHMAVRIGEVTDGAKVTQWPLSPKADEKETADTAEANPDYMETGRDVAVAVLPASGGLPELTVSMTHEAPDFWKIDVPDNMTLEEIQENLVGQLENENGDAKEWPADENETERKLVRRVVMALYGVEETDEPSRG